MGILHDLASDGLHARPDEECIEIFDACRKTFEYVFGKMRLEMEEARNFVKDITQLEQRRTRPTGLAKAASDKVGLNSPPTPKREGS